MNENEGSKRDFLLISESPAFLKADLADGTNVPAGTDFVYWAGMGGNFLRLEQHSEASGWGPRAQRLLTEMRSYRERALPVGAILTQRRIPIHLDNGTPWDLRDEAFIMMGGGAHVECAQLFASDGRTPISGVFPFLDAKGQPIRFPDGKPSAWRLGFSREFTLVRQPRSSADDAPWNGEVSSISGTTVSYCPGSISIRLLTRRLTTQTSLSSFSATASLPPTTARALNSGEQSSAPARGRLAL